MAATSVSVPSSSPNPSGWLSLCWPAFTAFAVPGRSFKTLLLEQAHNHQSKSKAKVLLTLIYSKGIQAFPHCTNAPQKVGDGQMATV